MAAAPYTLQRLAHGFTLLTFAPEHLGIARKPNGPGGQSVPLSPADVLAQFPDVAAAVAGPMFNCCPDDPHCLSHYSTNRCVRADVRLVDLARNVNVPTDHPTAGATIAVVRPTLLGAARAVAARGSTVPAGTTVAVQGRPLILWQGQNVADPTKNLQAVWRPALAILRDGRLAFGIAQSSMRALGDHLLAAGATDAVYLDGGGSGALTTRADGYTGSSEHRRIPVWVVVNDRPMARGISPTVLALGVAGVGVAGFLSWRAWSRKRERPKGALRTRSG